MLFIFGDYLLLSFFVFLFVFVLGNLWLRCPFFFIFLCNLRFNFLYLFDFLAAILDLLLSFLFSFLVPRLATLLFAVLFISIDFLISSHFDPFYFTFMDRLILSHDLNFILKLLAFNPSTWILLSFITNKKALMHLLLDLLLLYIDTHLKNNNYIYIYILF